MVAICLLTGCAEGALNNLDDAEILGRDSGVDPVDAADADNRDNEVGEKDASVTKDSGKDTGKVDPPVTKQPLRESDLNGCSGWKIADSDFNKKVTLTFEDGPSRQVTPEILDVLKAEGISATFLINGRRVVDDTTRGILHRIINEGHILGNHSQTHADFSKLGLSEAIAEIEETDTLLESVNAAPSYFRFPYGKATCETAMAVAERDYTIVGWTVDTFDWCFDSNTDGVGYCSYVTKGSGIPSSMRRDLAKYAVSEIKKKNGGVVVFQDLNAHTADKLPEIISTLRDEGFSFTNIDDSQIYPSLNGSPTPFVGQACTKDSECRFDVDGTPGFCHTFDVGGDKSGFCSIACQGTCPDQADWSSTFCGTTNGAGICMVTPGKYNGECKTIPGSAPKSVERFVGSSGALRKTATVCHP